MAIITYKKDEWVWRRSFEVEFGSEFWWFGEDVAEGLWLLLEIEGWVIYLFASHFL